MNRDSFRRHGNWCWAALLPLLALGCGGSAASESTDDDRSMVGSGARASSGGTGGVGSGGRDNTGGRHEGSGGSGAGGTGMSGVACNGSMVTEADPERCRTSVDCTGGELCQAWEQTFVGCGICFEPANECFADDECDPGEICETFYSNDPCSCSSSGFACAPACTEDSCGDGERCREDGHCEPIPCDEGFVCPADQVCKPEGSASAHGCGSASCETDGFECAEGFTCEPGVEGADGHGCRAEHCTEGFACPNNTRCEATSASFRGCERLTCAEDGDCDCGFCIDGSCQDQLFFCNQPPPP